jgi:hypothetical protein
MLDRAEIDALFRPARRFEPTTVVTARRLTAPQSWHTDAGTPLRAEPGDWELTAPDGDRWTITDNAFTRSYRQRPDGRYGKWEVVEAVRLRRPVEVPTAEGPSSGRPGDWLLRDDTGAVWPVPDRRFRDRYRPAGPTADQVARPRRM